MFRDDGIERSLPASAAKLDRTARSGHVPRSRWLSTALGISAFSLCIWFWGPGLVSQSAHMMKDSFRTVQMDVSTGTIGEQVSNATVRLVPALIGLATVPILTVLLWGYIQNGFRLSLRTEHAFVKINRPRPLFALSQVMVGFVLLAVVGSLIPYGELLQPGNLGESWKEVQGVMGTICLCLLGVGILDYAWNWLSWRESLKMSYQEQRDETRDTEPPPQQKQRRRERYAVMSGQGRAVVNSTIGSPMKIKN